jgi:hypothetical protein
VRQSNFWTMRRAALLLSGAIGRAFRCHAKRPVDSRFPAATASPAPESASTTGASSTFVRPTHKRSQAALCGSHLIRKGFLETGR